MARLHLAALVGRVRNVLDRTDEDVKSMLYMAPRLEEGRLPIIGLGQRLQNKTVNPFPAIRPDKDLYIAY